MVRPHGEVRIHGKGAIVPGRWRARGRGRGRSRWPSDGSFRSVEGHGYLCGRPCDGGRCRAGVGRARSLSRSSRCHRRAVRQARRIRSLSRRIVNATIALGYAGLAARAIMFSIGGSSSAHADNDAAARHWSARTLGAPLGRPLLLAVAAGISVAAVVQLIRVVLPGAGRRRLRIEDMSARQRTVLAVFGRLAFLCRATIFATIAYFLWKAAIFRAPNEARGSGGALHAAWESPHGNALLAVMAVGLVAVGVFALLEARWRRLFRP